MWVRVVIAIVLLLLPASAFAQVEKRIALLIGNQGYAAKVGPLKNPHNDVNLIEASLKQIGFRVTVFKDAGYREMDTAIKEHIATVRKAGREAISFFYYSGHGVANPDTQINYLIPTDVKDANDPKLWHLSFEQNDIIEKLNRQAPQATHYVVFDACRNELRLSGEGQKALGGAEKGFAPVAQTAGLLIAYATAPKQTASDVGEGGGPYAKVLAAEMVRPDIEAVTMFRNVQLKVKQSIGQDPWLSFPSLPEVYLAGKAKSPRPSEAAEAWDRAKDTNSITVLEAFIIRFNETFYADMARAQLEKLKAGQLNAGQSEERSASSLGIIPTEMVPARPFKKGSSATANPPRRTGMRLVELSCDDTWARVGDDERCLKAGDTFKDCPDCPEMVVVPAGSFMMGSPDNEEKHENDEGPMHKVTIAKPFAVGKFEVTLDEWSACVAAGDCLYKANGVGKHPASNVSWYDITNGFLPWLSRTARRTYRLLTEAEWEYAALAGTTTPFSTGGMITPEQANFDGREVYGGSGKGVYRARTVEVGTFRPNFFGLYDMHGNVSEWVEDCYKDSYTGAPSDGSAVIGDCASRVLRGGSSSGGPWVLRSAKRLASNPGIRSYNQGFRLARTLSQ